MGHLMTVRICPIEDAACEELPIFRRCEGCKKLQPDYKALYEDLCTHLSEKLKEEARQKTLKNGC
jgi:hypothetical protein